MKTVVAKERNVQMTYKFKRHLVLFYSSLARRVNMLYAYISGEEKNLRIVAFCDFERRDVGNGVCQIAEKTH